MNETLILLALDSDAMCTGPRHTLAKTRWSNNRLQELSSFDFPPLYWIADCGARGMVFVDAPILGERPECFDCRVKLAPASSGSWPTQVRERRGTHRGSPACVARVEAKEGGGGVTLWTYADSGAPGSVRERPGLTVNAAPEGVT